MALDNPAPLYPTAYDDSAPYAHDDMASLVASTSSGFTGLDAPQHHYQQYQQNASHGSQAHAAAAAQAAQQQGQLTQSLTGVGRRHRTVPAKTFKCTGFGDCAMVFSRSEHLARHVRKHTGERPFACHCSKQFSRLDNLRQHAQTVHADRPELNARMMARLVEVQGTMASLSKAGNTSPSAPSAPSSAGCSKPHPPRALSLSLSLSLDHPAGSSASPTHIKSEGGSPDLSLLPSNHGHTTGHNGPQLSLQQRKARRGLPLTLSSADIAAANMHAGFHLQGHATAPLPRAHAHLPSSHGFVPGHGQGMGYHHPLSSPHALGMHEQHAGYPAAPHSASAHQTHFPHHAASAAFSLDGLAPAHHHALAHHGHGLRGRGVEFTQSEYGSYKVPSHGHGHAAHSEYAPGDRSPAHEFPFYADVQHPHASGHGQAPPLPSPPYSAASASGYFPSVPQKLEEMLEQPAYAVKQEELSVFDGFNAHQHQQPASHQQQHPHAHQQHQQHQLHHQHSQTWSTASSGSPAPSSHAAHARAAAYVSPPITPHLASFPSLSLNGGGSSEGGSMSPHSHGGAFSAAGSPVIPPSVGSGGAFDGSSESAFDNGAAFDATAAFDSAGGFEGSVYDGGSGSGYEGSLSPEQAAFESGYVQQHHACQQQQQQFDQFDAQHQQQQQEYYHAEQQQQQQQQQRWLAQQQYRREHGFAA